MNCKNVFSLLSRGTVATLCLISPLTLAHAGTLTTSATAPTTDVYDVFQAAFDTPGTFNGSQDFTDNPTPGQTFTAPNSAAFFTLDSLTVKGSGGGITAGGGGFNTNNWNVRISSVSGTTLTPLATESASAAPLPNDDNFSYYITFSFATPVTLTAGNTYAWDLYSDNGYFGLASTASGDTYTGGESFNTASARSFSSNTATFHTGVDRTFYANLSAAVVPEPGTVALLALPLAGFMGIILRRRTK